MKRVCFGIMVALALAAAPALAQQAQTSAGTSTGRAKVCRDSKGAAYSTGALLRAADGSIDRCQDGEWVAAPPGAERTTPQRQTSTPQPPPRPGQESQGLASLASISNVRLELTITDQSGAGQATQKAVTLLLAERAEGRVRSRGEVYRAGTAEAPGSQYVPVILNADAHIEAIDGDRIRASITVAYEPATPGPADTLRVANLNQTVTVILVSGKPTTLVEASDPLSDRKVTLEATATILR